MQQSEHHGCAWPASPVWVCALLSLTLGMRGKGETTNLLCITSSYEALGEKLVVRAGRRRQAKRRASSSSGRLGVQADTTI